MQSIELNGKWSFRRVGDPDWLELTVPGSVYSGLLENHQIGQPYARDNSRALKKYSEYDYEFEREFHLERDVLESDRIELFAEGLDTVCDIYINDKKVAACENMHRRYAIDVTEALREENRIRIHFFSPLRYIAQKQEELPLWNCYHCEPGYPQIRKAHYMFGWDWAPNLPDMGIYRGISLRAYNGVKLEDVFVRQRHEADGVWVTVRTTQEILEQGNYQTVLTLTAPDGKELARRSADTAPTNEWEIRVEQPELWWPNGCGEQPLYRVRAEVVRDGSVLERNETAVGLREITVCQEKDEYGTEFAFRVNGLKIFAMGGCCVPQDCLLASVSRERTYRLLADMKKANCNMVRVWGGGVYPSDDFFDICDELGLLVWEDFMFACAIYNFDEAFVQNTRAELIDVLKRLRNHPSLALWCGNNELEDAWVYWGIDEKYKSDDVKEGYLSFFEGLVPELVNEYDPDTFYWASSPSSGGSFDEPRDESRGDVHYWGILDDNEPVENFSKKNFRFLSEFGIQSFPCAETVSEFTDPGERNIFSRIFEWHQKHYSTNTAVLKLVFDEFRYPCGFDDTLYATQLLQASVIKYAVEHFRSIRGRCMGTLYWQANDCWPCASWSGIDYYGRWKALQYFAKKFFAPLLVTCQPDGTCVPICLVNDSARARSGVIEWSLCTEDGGMLRSGSAEAEIEPYSSKQITSVELSDALTEDVLYRSYFYVRFAGDGGTLCENSSIFVKNKWFEFSDPGIAYRLERKQGQCKITLSARSYARYVEVRLPDSVLSDNYFELYPGQEKKILFDAPDAEPRRIPIRSVYDIGRQEQVPDGI